jgi:tellurite resistance protein
MNINTHAIRRLRDYLLSRIETTPQDNQIDATTEADTGQNAIAARVEPFAETMYLVMIADGEPSSEEQDALIAAIDVLTDGRLTRQNIDGMLARFDVNVARDGVEARIARIGARLSADQEDRETAFTLAAAIALADDRIHLEENQAIAWIGEYYGLSNRRIATLLETID